MEAVYKVYTPIKKNLLWSEQGHSLINTKVGCNHDCEPQAKLFNQSTQLVLCSDFNEWTVYELWYRLIIWASIYIQWDHIFVSLPKTWSSQRPRICLSFSTSNSYGTDYMWRAFIESLTLHQAFTVARCCSYQPVWSLSWDQFSW